MQGLSWSVYGMKDADLVIILPNALGFIFSIVNLILYTIYKKNKNPN